jgi:N-acetylglucosamine PTS system EIICBA or EIICB component
MNKSDLKNLSLKEKAAEILKAVGTQENIENIDACVTRIRLVLKDASLVNEITLKELGANGLMDLGNGYYHIVMGTLSDPLATLMKEIVKEGA